MKIPNLPIEKFKTAEAGTGIKLSVKRSAGSAFKSKIEHKLFKASSGAKFVLFIGDEGAILVYIKGNVVQSRQFVPDGNDENLKELQASLEGDVKAPILLVVDNMDQTYVQQTLPPVSPLSINKLIKRRLERDFGSSEIKGAILLGREQTGRKDWNFMMVAVEKSPQLSVWIDFISGLPNRFRGIYLVSTEAERIVHEIENAMGVPPEGTGAEWKFFVSHNKVGGVRQVIMRGGRITFTRMTQLIGESTPEVIAGNIEQEIFSTLEYMRRLGYNAQAGLDIYIVASSALKPLIDQSKFGASSMHILTPYEIAQYLHIEGATQPTDQFGDVILAAAIGCSKKHVLTLTTPLSRQFDTLYNAALYQRIAAAVIGLGIIGYTCSTVYDIYSTYAKKAELEETKAFREKTLESLKAEIKKSHLDVEKTGDLIMLYQQLQKDKLTPLPFIEQIGAIIKRPIEITKINWSLDNTKAGEPNKMTAVLTLGFPGIDTLDAFKAISKKILAELKDNFKDADIKFTKLPPKFSENEKMDISFDNKGAAGGPALNGDASDAELTIKGDVLAAASRSPAPPQSAPLISAPTP